MNQHKLIALGMLAGMSTFALVACGDDETTPSQTADTGVSDASDGSSDLDAAPPTDTTSDAAPDVTPDVVPDSTPEDGSSTPDVEEPSVCPGSISCFDERTGAPSIAVCRAGGFPEGTTCVIGDDDEACCVAPFACVTDQDCDDNREAEGFCADARFPCVCVEGGICVTELCSSSAECDEGEVCSGGICGSPPAGVDREARLLNRTEYVQPGTTLQAMGVAVSVDDPRLTDPFATLTYASSDADVARDAAESHMTTVLLFPPSDQAAVGLLAKDESFLQIRLLAEFLEKGVIRKTRYWVTFWRHHPTYAEILDCYIQLQHEPLPLTP